MSGMCEFLELCLDILLPLPLPFRKGARLPGNRLVAPPGEGTSADFGFCAAMSVDCIAQSDQACDKELRDIHGLQPHDHFSTR
jgi:hypothetical protein